MSLKKFFMNLYFKYFPIKFVILGVPGIIQNSRGEILLGKRSGTAPFYPLNWGLPGGLVDYGETLEQAIRREIKEEIEVDSKVIKHGKPFNDRPSKKSRLHAINIPMYCKIIGKPKVADETCEVRWFSPKEIRKMRLAYKHKEILKQEGLI